MIIQFNEKKILLFFVSTLYLQSCESGQFWQLTDIHWDARYSITGDPTAMCHRSDKGKATNNGHFGNYLCDSPWILVKSALDSMKNLESNPDFILWTGDNAPHTRDPPPQFPEIFNATSKITEELIKTFNKTTIIPVLGNHDTFPKDDYPANNGTFYKTFLEKSGWKPLLNEDAQSEFCFGGYFSTILPDGLKVLSVNSLLYYFPNKMGTPSRDPANQFAWMKSHFEEARKSQKKVLVAAHAPPGFWERNGVIPFFNATYNEKYVNMMVEYSDVIIANIFGHEHTDSFRIFHNNGSRSSVGFLAPSVTPWFPSRMEGGTAINPSLRLYQYNASTLVDYSQYHMNLSEANGNKKLWGSCERRGVSDKGSSCESSLSSLWKLYYKAQEEFSVSALSATKMLDYHERLSKNDSLFQRLYRINSAGIVHPYCDSDCKRNHLCAITQLQIEDFYACKASASNSTDSNYQMFRPPATAVTVVLTIALTIVLSLMLIIILAKRKRILTLSERRDSHLSNMRGGYRLLHGDGD